MQASVRVKLTRDTAHRSGYGCPVPRMSTPPESGLRLDRRTPGLGQYGSKSWYAVTDHFAAVPHEAPLGAVCMFRTPWLMSTS